MKGICFKEDMFGLTIEGKKTQTRRLVKIPARRANKEPIMYETVGEGITQFGTIKLNGSDIEPLVEVGIKPRYMPGETVFLKEPYFYSRVTPEGFPGETIYYQYLSETGDAIWVDWQNKLYMPAEYARYFIKITGVRIQRLSEISTGDASAEGFVELPNIIRFFEKWDGIHGKKSRELDPYVWVYDYELTTIK